MQREAATLQEFRCEGTEQSYQVEKQDREKKSKKRREASNMEKIGWSRGSAGIDKGQQLKPHK